MTYANIIRLYETHCRCTNCNATYTYPTSMFTTGTDGKSHSVPNLSAWDDAMARKEVLRRDIKVQRCHQCLLYKVPAPAPTPKAMPKAKHKGKKKPTFAHERNEVVRCALNSAYRAKERVPEPTVSPSPTFAELLRETLAEHIK